MKNSKLLSALLLALSCSTILVGCNEESSSPDSSPVQEVVTSFKEGDGTEANPYNVTQALAKAKTLTQGKSTEVKFYFTGVVSYIKENSKGVLELMIDNEGDYITVYQLIKSINGEEVSYYSEGDEGLPQKNDVVVLKSNIQNFYGTYELTNNELISITEGPHPEVKRTPFPAEDQVTWIGSVANLSDGNYVLGGKDGNKLMLVSTEVTSKKAIAKNYSTDLIVEDFVYYVNVEGNTLSFRSVETRKYVAYAGSGTDIVWSAEEFFWSISDVDGQVRLTTSDGKRLFRLNSGTGKWGAYALSTYKDNSVSDVIFYKVD